MESANILIVEDDLFEAEHLKLHLQQAGHHIVDILSSGEEAIARVNHNGIDIMLVDIVLSGELDGIEAVQQIRNKQDIPVIFLTAHVNADLLLRAERARPFAYLLKPYRQLELEFMINMSLARKRVEQELATQKDLAEAELRQAQAIIHHTNEGVMITNSERIIMFVNPAFSRITGYELDDCIGQKTSILNSGRHDDAFYADIWFSIEHYGHWQGELWNRRKNGEIYPEWLTINPIAERDGSIRRYVGIFSDISSIKQSEAELEHLAHHDPLTNLPNRLLLMTRLRYSLRTASRHRLMCAVLYIDLDRFKLINDSLGHEIGDVVLQTVARRFENQVREADMVARLGGDEFVVLLEGITDPVDASLIAQKIIQSLEQPVMVNDHRFSISCSIGIAIYPKDGNTVEDLLRDADSAMYQAKKMGMNNIVFYTEDMTRKAYRRIKLYSELRQALVNQEFRLHYQPQINMKSASLIGVEALIRWKHPEKGLMGPKHFIQEAEDTGLIIPIGIWVLQQACRDMKSWLDKGLKFGRVSVNVAGPQLQRGDLLTVVNMALAKAELKPQYLELELTETYAMELIESHLQTLNDLNTMGVSIAIDDFGTGTSSLSKLKNLHIDKLKIDRSFVTDIPMDKNDEAITRAIIGMSHTLGLSVIAEGVETKSQEQFLIRENCLFAQGFLYSKPLNIIEFEKFAAKYNPLPD
ncbi:MAG: EAL domain-containing protein [Gammaproteobacteria bacterium]|nr:EAL domain-containing protein [Gammaproteobacteria bacterium]MBL7000713.1 EAL domain-containing protein [Gammaproteobacteria bacterium]